MTLGEEINLSDMQLIEVNAMKTEEYKSQDILHCLHHTCIVHIASSPAWVRGATWRGAAKYKVFGLVNEKESHVILYELQDGNKYHIWWLLQQKLEELTTISSGVHV